MKTVGNFLYAEMGKLNQEILACKDNSWCELVFMTEQRPEEGLAYISWSPKYPTGKENEISKNKPTTNEHSTSTESH